MELIKIDLINFRQFYGKQSIEFSHNDEKNVTIIFGENGKGKTGIFRALMFGLFGDELLDQDDDKGPKIHLVNLKALNDHRNEVVNGTVSVRFIHKGELYEIERSIQAIMDNKDQIEERFNDPILYKGEENVFLKNNPINDKIEILRLMDIIINEKIKKFFLFDGEKIDTLATTSKRVKEEVKEAVTTMMQIKTLEKCIDTLHKIKSNETKRLKAKNNDYDLSTASNNIEQLKNDISLKQDELERKQEEFEKCSDEIKEIKDKIASSEALENNYREIKAVEDKINYKTQELKQIQEQIRERLVTKSSSLLMNDYYHRVSSYLDSIMDNQENSLPIEFLKLSLKNNRCVCCNNDLGKDYLARKFIENLKKNYKYNEMSTLISLISNHIQDFNSDSDETKDNIQKKMTIYSEEKQELYKFKDQLRSLKEKESLTVKEHKNLEDLKRSLEKDNNDRSRINKIIGSIENDIAQKEKALAEKESDLDNILKSRKEYQKDYKVIEKITEVEKYFSRIFTSYSNEMKNVLSNAATSIFNQLIDEKDKGLVKNIEINSKYEIVVRDSMNLDITQDISQGQRRMVSISFITALAKVATGNKDRVDFPLFMDTPFGSFSGNNRDNLINNIPHLTSQWILLLTDTELTKNEEFTFKSTNKLGRWYELVQKEKYYTEIVEKNLNENMSRRG